MSEGFKMQSGRIQITPQLKKAFRADEERLWEKVRKDFLPDLANVTDESCKRFRERYKVIDPLIEESAILQFRDQLRTFWSGDDNYQDHRREHFRFSWLHIWLRQARQSPQEAWSVGTYADGTHSVRPNVQNFPLFLAIAASDFSQKMAICGNPDCPQKYFLKGRKTQRFCDLPACSAYGQRQHKLNWWKAHKDELKAKPKRTSSRAKRKRRH